MAIPARYVPFGDGYVLTVRVMLNLTCRWYSFVLDTGSVHLAIAPAVCAELGLRPVGGTFSIPDPTTGTVRRADALRLESLIVETDDDTIVGRVRPYAVALDWQAAPGFARDIDGLLGMQFLMEYAHVHIDVRTPRLVFDRPS